MRATATVDFEQVDVARLMAATHLFGGAGAIGGKGRRMLISRSLGDGQGHLREPQVPSYRPILAAATVRSLAPVSAAATIGACTIRRSEPRIWDQGRSWGARRGAEGEDRAGDAAGAVDGDGPVAAILGSPEPDLRLRSVGWRGRAGGCHLSTAWFRTHQD